MAGITSTKKIKGQKHFLAYITPSEAKTLENLGGQKTMTKEGVPAYPPSNDARGESRGRGPEAGNSGRERGAEQNRSSSTPSKSTSPKNNTPDRNKDNDGGQTIQDYYDDQTNLTDKEVISDKDRDEFFETPVGKTYKEAAEKAAKAKEKQKADAKKEKDRIQAILDSYKGTTPAAYAYGPPIKNYKKDYFIGPNKYSTTTKMRQLALKNLIDKKLGIKSTMPSVFELNNLLNPSMVDQDYTYNSGITTDMMGVDLTPEQQAERLQDYSDIGKYGLTGKNMTDIDRMNRALDEGRSSGNITQTEFEDAFNNQNINTSGGSGGDDPIIYTGTGTTDDTTDDEVTYDYRFGDPNANTALDVTLGRYFNQGGRVPRNMGGIMNAVPRQGYFLGKIVKGAKKFVGGVADAAGKVLKSDIGKMALIYGATAGLGSLASGGGFGSLFKAGTYNPANFLGKQGYLSKIAGKALLKDPSAGFGLKDNLSLGKILGLSAVLPFIPGINKAPPNEDNFSDRGGSLIDPITGEEALPSQMRASLNDALDNADGDPAKIKQITDAYAFLTPDERLGSYLPYRTYGVKDGGRIGRAEGGLMNLGGMEKDYRAEGGFVPIGREEKADDVPARLSVNEFVFTADAVRNAGGGDIDRGAEVMENMMKNLENGGRVSEESQGNTGAQDMFSVSERIGEVI